MIPDSRRLIGFDSKEIAVAHRFEQYRAIYSGGADATELGPQFRASMRGVSLDRAVIYDRVLADIGHERTAARCRRDDYTHFTLTVMLSGDFHADSGTGFRKLVPGDIILLDMTKPMRNRANDAHILTFSMARDRIAAVQGERVAQLHGHVIDAARGFLLAEHLQAVARHMALIRADMLIPLSRISADMLATALGSEGHSQSGLERYAQMVRLDNITAFIEENLPDRDLDTLAIVDRFGISRATLYRMFHTHGGVGRYIRKRRLNRLRTMLIGDQTSSLNDIALKTGFSSEAIASEAFVSAFGARPGGYRKRMASETSWERSQRQMTEWTAELC